MLDPRKIGNMDRRVTIKSVTRTVDTYGAPVKVYVTLFSAWASREEASGSANQEQQTANRTIYPGSFTYYMHYRSGVTEDMLMVDGTTEYNITSAVDIERKMFLRLTVEKVID